jgi:hypothetical protein
MPASIRTVRFRARLTSAWPVAVVLGCAIQALAAGWGRFGDIMVDTGRELEWPRRILEGEWLYRDLRFIYGPLAPCLNAGLYALFGVRVEVLAVAGALTGLLMAWVVYLMARELTGRLGATAAAVTFVYACAFAYLDERAIFNFVLPHAFAATYGILAASASLLLVLRHLRSGAPRHLHLSLLCLGLSALAKVEVLFPALVVHGLFVASRFAAGGVRRLLPAYAAAAAGVALAYLPFALVAGPTLWRDNLLGMINPASEFFVRMQMGLTEPGLNLARMAVALGVLLVACVLLLGAGFLASRLRAGGPAAPYALAVPPAVAFAWLAARFQPLAPVVFRALTVVVVAGALGAAVLWWARPAGRARALPVLLVFAFALAAQGRIVLNATPELYGYFLLPPSLVCLAALLFGGLPALLRHEGPGRRVAAAVAVAFLGCLAWALEAHTLERLARKVVRLETPRGALTMTPEDAERFLPAIRVLQAAPAGATLLTVPQSMSVSFLTGHPCPDGNASHLPMDFSGGYSDAWFRDRWRRVPPDYVLWVDEEMDYFGGERFCATYGRQACTVLLEGYRPVGGPASARFGLVRLLARREPRPPGT